MNNQMVKFFLEKRPIFPGITGFFHWNPRPTDLMRYAGVAYAVAHKLTTGKDTVGIWCNPY
jgi:hypothetical protein